MGGGGGFWVVVGGFWVVVGGYWLVVGGWWLKKSFTFLSFLRQGGVYIITSGPAAAFSGVQVGRSQYPRGPQWIL